MQFSDPAHPAEEGAPQVHASMAQDQVCGERIIAAKPGNNLGVHSGIMSVMADARPQHSAGMNSRLMSMYCAVLK